MPIDLYLSDPSPPCFTVRLAARAIGVDLNLIYYNTHVKENLTPEFLKLNPQHTLPTIVDNGFSLWESRAIIIYLQNQYGKDDSLYPKDPKKRAVVDQRLYFDISTFQRLLDYYDFQFTGGTPEPDKLEKLDKALGFLDTFLENSEFAAGDHLTLADFSLVTTVFTLEQLGHDLSPFKNVTRWYAKVKQTIPGYDEIATVVLIALKKVIEEQSKK